MLQIHITSIDFIILSTFAPFWVYNDMTARKRYAPCHIHISFYSNVYTDPSPSYINDNLAYILMLVQYAGLTKVLGSFPYH